VREVYGKSQVHVDFMKEATLEVRFDLYEELPSYRKLEIRPALFESIIENSRSLAFDDGTVSANVRVPSEIDEMLVRYLEFIEWYDVRPDKIRHLDYILHAGDDVAQRRLVEKLHHYTKIPPVRAPEIKNGRTLVGSVRGLWERFFSR